MRAAICACVFTLLLTVPTCAGSVTLTFDGIPGLLYYRDMYHVAFGGFNVADHSASSWWTPHSGSSVVVTKGDFGLATIAFKGLQPSQPWYAYSVSGYFSTEQGAVLQMIAYHNNVLEDPVASVTIGVEGQSWDNVYIQMAGSDTINFIDIHPVTTDALLHFSVDDIALDFVPEPPSLLALLAGLGGFGMLLRRRGR